MKDKFQTISWYKEENEEKEKMYRDKSPAIPIMTVIQGNKKEVLGKFKKIKKDHLKNNKEGKIILVKRIA